ncbi:AAA family ATPase [Pseudonocardia sp. DSM 110487]|uniref:AfsR/SARP family transcriptional regulator n=1 Tax=Pseudonocardia sp. DSM 110487 TaxID=2865833 RepID=UPI001C695AD7|nr:BTAD domain-containing putative transcriptional regulator [Pseudonocardia sp. DSM 110487]QYN32291.1 AAA family ATPase [Pseudonocardia sp. DSM 110487]
MRFGVLGPLAVWTANGEPVRIPELKVRALLADLLVHAGRPVGVDRLIDDLWAERAPRDPLGALQTRVSQLRRALGRDLVVFQPPGYLLRVGDEALDVTRFRRLTARAAAAADPRERAGLLADALALWRGPALADFADEEFARAATARWEEERLDALESRAEARLALGEHGAVAAELGELVARHPLRERLRAAHLRALHRSGRQTEALAGFREFRERLADKLGLEPGRELVTLHEAILRHDPAEEPAPEVDALPRTNLPEPLTAVVGREDAVAAVQVRLTGARLVTLTGPGGVGKTRLALEVAAGLRDPDGDGPWLVELAALEAVADTGAGATDAIATSIAAALGLRDDPRSAANPAERVTDALRTRRTLLVLDNCEHVAGAVADLVDALLRAAPDVRVLATSREPLRVAGEALWPVPPLTLPAPDASPAQQRATGAVRLFAARAAAAAPDFVLDDATAAAVARICRRLDGLPLALELAATRVRVFGVHELADRLDGHADRSGLLGTGPRGAPARQRTLRATIDWSWGLLDAAERVVLRRLAVQAGAAPLDTAVALAGPDAGRDAVDVLAGLVDRSLVSVIPGGAGEPTRYRLLESVRDYGLDRLAEAGEVAATRQRHLEHHVALAERAAARLRGPEQARWLRVLENASADLRAALDTAVATRAAEAALGLVDALGWHWCLLGRWSEALRCCALALGVAEGRTDLGARVAVWQAGFSMLSGSGVDVLPGALAAADGLADAGGRARARWFLAFAHRGRGELATTARLVEDVVERAAAVGDRWSTAAALAVRATVARAGGALDAAARDAERSDLLFQELGDRWGRLRATTTLAELAEIAGDYARAVRLHREGLRMAEELQLRDEASMRLSGLGRIALLAGDLAEADALHERARRMAVHGAHPVAEEFAEIGLALSARRAGRFADAERHLRRWIDWLRTVDGEPGLALVLAELGFVAEQRGDLAAARRTHLDGLAAARRVGDPRAIALALEGLAGAQTARGPERAAELLGAAEALRAGVGAPLPPSERGDVDRISGRLRETLGAAAFEEHVARGARRAWPELVPV